MEILKSRKGLEGIGLRWASEKVGWIGIKFSEMPLTGVKSCSISPKPAEENACIRTDFNAGSVPFNANAGSVPFNANAGSVPFNAGSVPCFIKVTQHRRLRWNGLFVAILFLCASSILWWETWLKVRHSASFVVSSQLVFHLRAVDWRADFQIVLVSNHEIDGEECEQPQIADRHPLEL
jgi:hypothetical protein